MGCVGGVCWRGVLVGVLVSCVMGCVGGVCWWGVLEGCVGRVCWKGVLMGCVGGVCWGGVLAGCVGGGVGELRDGVCWGGVLRGCVGGVCWWGVLVGVLVGVLEGCVGGICQSKCSTGAFLIPFILMLFLIGVPIFMLEISLGQFCNLSPLNVFKISPILKGFSNIPSFFLNLNFNFLMYLS